MKVIISDDAADDIEHIFAWIAKDNPVFAIQLIRNIRGRIGRLETPGLSYMGRLGQIAGTRELVESTYIIVYAVGKREITILAVLHTAQDR